jgi:hypothetical protein
MPLSITGCKADHLCAVSRIHNDDALMVVAARLPSRLEADPKRAGAERLALPGGLLWQLLIDTKLADEAELGTFAIGEVYGVTGRSLLLFAFEPDPAAWDNDSRADPPI